MFFSLVFLCVSRLYFCAGLCQHASSPIHAFKLNYISVCFVTYISVSFLVIFLCRVLPIHFKSHSCFCPPQKTQFYFCFLSRLYLYFKKILIALSVLHLMQFDKTKSQIRDTLLSHSRNELKVIKWCWKK